MDPYFVALVAASGLFIGIAVGLFGFTYYSASIIRGLARGEVGEVLTAVESDRLASNNLRSEAAEMLGRAETTWNRARGAESRVKKAKDVPDAPAMTEEAYIAGLENGSMKVNDELENRFGW